MREQVDYSVQLMKETAGRSQAGVAIGVVMIIIGCTSHDELVLMRWAGLGIMLLCLYVLLLIRLRQELREQNEHLTGLIQRTAQHVRENGAEVGELRSMFGRSESSTVIRDWLTQHREDS